MKVQTILVGFDGSAMAKLALDAAARLADDRSVVHVVTAAPEMTKEKQRQVRQLPEEFRLNFDPYAQAERILAQATEVLAAQGITPETHLVSGDPATAILDVAKRTGADIVVVGSRGTSRGKRFLRGSVSSRIATHAPHSVMIVHQAA